VGGMFDSDTVDLFSLQNEITNALANALGVELIAAEAARPSIPMPSTTFSKGARHC
jgi:hypothetical protein